MKKISYVIEALFLALIFIIFKCMPYETASNVGGWVGRTIGPRLAASRKAYNNIEKSLPGRTDDEYAIIVRDMWDNLGRVIAEYPHLTKIQKDVEVIGQEYLTKLRLEGRFVAIGAHLSNWEIIPHFLNYASNYNTTCVYREPNNPYVIDLLMKARNPEGKLFYAPKSMSGSRQLVKAIKDGGSVGILFDQKYNQGIRATFFGRPAMTSESFVQLARKYDCPIIPIWVERIKGAKFRVVIEQPFKVDGRTDEEVIEYAHRLLEQEIMKSPANWLWLHRRWIT